MKTVSPVVTGLEDFEIVFGDKQPEYEPLIALVGELPQQHVISRWELTAEERELIAKGADIYTSQMTFGDRFQPLSVFVGNKDGDANQFMDMFGVGGIVQEKKIAEVLDKLLPHE